MTRYAIVEIPDGLPPPEAIAIGGLDEIMQFLPQTVASRGPASTPPANIPRVPFREPRSPNFYPR
jgi:hypothetical protein